LSSDPCAALSEVENSELDQVHQGEEGLLEAEPNIHLEADPFESNSRAGPDHKWKEMIRTIKLRKPEFPSLDEQRARIRELLGMLDAEPDNPSTEQVEQAQC
jgi:hypothetical protein